MSRRRTCEWIGHKVANRFNAWLKEKQPPFSSHHQPTPPEFNAFSTPVRVPRSDYSPFMDGTFVYRHVSTGSLPVWVLVAREKWKGPFMWEGDCWWEETRGMIVMMDPQGHRCSLPLMIFVSCQIELGKLFFSFLGCRPKCGVVLLQEQLAVDVRQALEGSASYVLDEDLCPSTKDRE